MLIDKVCSISELEMKNENHIPKWKSKKKSKNDKSSWNFQSVFENEIKREKHE